ncbi:MAG: prepilin-type N-terminal cleavage/methylation domain-containing protein [Geobacteraceae bacterium]|nr:prepilin-type N-terminal cleavage/methylation domain-containing protein [Geobacteraceae bacterium]
MKLKYSTHTRGFTLIELVIVMAIFMIVMIISAKAFENVIKISTRTLTSAQSQIEGIVGLQILRTDLNAAGYGLPWSFQTDPNPASYLEADLGADNPVKGLSADDFNDAPPNSSTAAPTPTAPRAVVVGTVPVTQDPIFAGTGMNANPGSKYLVIKSAAVAFNSSVGKWGYVNYSGSQSYIPKSNSAEDLVANEAVITQSDKFGNSAALHVLAMQDASHFSYTLGATDAFGRFVPPDSNYMPSGYITDPFGAKITNEKMITYAIKSFDAGSTDSLRMPFNRADYFVMRPTGNSMPSRCNPGTGVLYKAVIINSMTASGGGRTLYPLLDCVGDMQVLFDMQDPADANKTMTTDTLATLTAEDIRARLKAIRVFLLVQEGAKDNSYSYPYANANNVITVSDDHTPSLGRTFTKTDMINFFGPEWDKYRWKVYSVVGQPYNLMY